MPRLRCSTLLRVIAIVSLFCLWAHLMLSSSYLEERDAEELMNANESSKQLLLQVPPELHKYLLMQGRNLTGNLTELSINDIRMAIQRLNDMQTIYNEDLFGPVLNDTVIIVIQVHTRLTYLRHLIVSLAQARGIDRTLLIFSHDYYDEEINALVRMIDFAKVMQIFYPYSIQTHPDEFPGVDPNDCPRDAKYELAVKMKCNNAHHPDLHGHYREAKFCQTKHHWWWKANRIFNQLQCTIGHTGMVAFLEEDHYIAPDALHILTMMREKADHSCPECEILCLGSYLKTYQYHPNSENKVDMTPWHSTMHNMGMVLNRTVWNSIVELQEQFCAYDDYNWDYSLLHLSQNRPGKPKFKVMVCRGPRVFHIGECGFHHKKTNCNVSTVILKVQKLLATAQQNLFPDSLEAKNLAASSKHKKLVKGNGGWGDVRDRELCTNMTKIGLQERKYFIY